MRNLKKDLTQRLYLFSIGVSYQDYGTCLKVDDIDLHFKVTTVYRMSLWIRHLKDLTQVLHFFSIDDLNNIKILDKF